MNWIEFKQRVFARLAGALQLTDADPRYAYLGANERARIETILRETQPEVQEALR